jgi:sulfotransferase family protein
MPLQVIGAGIGRTGTNSLKVALEMLLDGPCYHMFELLNKLDDVPAWQAAADGEPVDWEALMATWVAGVDWPISAFWPELSVAFPDARILLSLRDSESWWSSASATINNDVPQQANAAWHAMVRKTLETRFTPNLQDKDECIAAYESHNAKVLQTASADRLIVWRPGDGWAPICEGLGLPIPDAPFPLTNTTADFLERTGR